MRDIIHSAVADAREFASEAVADFRQANKLTDDEVLQSYERMRGNPMAIIQFTQTNVGGATPDDVMQQAVRYEKQMEALRNQKLGGF